MTWPQWLLTIGFGLCVGGVMVATVTQGSPAGRYVMVSGLLPIAIGGVGALAQHLRSRHPR